MSLLMRNHHYLQISFNSSLDEAQYILNSIPPTDRILIEIGTPLIKQYGISSIRAITTWWQQRLFANGIITPAYTVADFKCMDRAATEVQLAKSAGASAVVALGQAPIETLNSFVQKCDELKIDSMIDMMNVEKPYNILRQLKTLPTVVMLHRGVDETNFSDKPLPIHMINKVKGSYNIKIAIAGGDTSREIQSAVFNGADIVVLWKDFFTVSDETTNIVTNFLNQVK